MIPEHVKESFGLAGPIEHLPGGTEPAYRAGNVVVKRIHAGSLETEHSLELAPWLAGELAQVEAHGFRLARPVATRDSEWMLEDGWAVWSYVEGHPPEAEDIPDVIGAVYALHASLRKVAKHPLLDQNTSAWGFAHRHCWGNRPEHVHPTLAGLVDGLYSRYQPLPPISCQLIHGDLNAENILVAPGQPPGFIDFTPFWAPVDFAVAMFANWIGPRQGDVSVLWHFEHIPHFDQLLFRAAVRMLLIVSELEGVAGWERAPEKRAAELVLDL
jgi:Ser/Thr protein kinase RdoA (MazF antagonist)